MSEYISGLSRRLFKASLPPAGYPGDPDPMDDPEVVEFAAEEDHLEDLMEEQLCWDVPQGPKPINNNPDSPPPPRAPICWYCREEECLAKLPLETIFGKLSGKGLSNKEAMLKALDMAEKVVDDVGGLTRGCPPLVFKKLPFCMFIRIFEAIPMECPFKDGCRQKPCVFINEAGREDALDYAITQFEEGYEPRQVRFYLYKLYTTLIHGHLGKKNRKKLPCCVENRIAELFPNEDGADRVGFKEA